MRIAVFGAGGVGGYFGGRLAQAGLDVTFVARGEHLHAIKEQGLFVESIAGNFAIQPAKAVANCENAGAIDLVLIATKGWQLGDAIESMRPMVSEKTILLPLLNGVEAVDQLSDAYGKENVLNGLCGIFAKVVAPGRISHFGAQPFIRFGEQDNQQSKRVTEICELLQQGDAMTVKVADDITAAVWKKFILIASTSGVGAVTRASFGAVRKHAETRSLLKAVVDENVAVAKAAGVGFTDELVADVWSFIDSAEEDSDTSMQRDVIAGKRSELDSLVGAVLRLAEKYDVAVPVNQMIYASLLPQEIKAQGS